MQYVYPCVLTPENEGGFFVSYPDVPEALTGGDNRAEALAMAEDALAAALGMYVKEREDIPVPVSRLRVRRLLPSRPSSPPNWLSTPPCGARASPRWLWPNAWA